jgi:signal transduction histidine kinase
MAAAGSSSAFPAAGQSAASWTTSSSSPPVSGGEPAEQEAAANAQPPDTVAQSVAPDLHGLAAVITNDLFVPLRAIRQHAEGLHQALKHDEPEPEVRKALSQIQRHASELWQRMNDLLGFLRVASAVQQPAPVDLQALAERVRSDLERRIALVNGRVEIHGLPTVVGDESQLRQLIEQLLDNALKFQPPDAEAVVRVSARRLRDPDDPHGWLIRIEDNGLGFDPHDAERIFQPFERLHAPGRFPGTGMGLAIARRIVERHGGTLRGQGQPGAGATFVVFWPEQAEET